MKMSLNTSLRTLVVTIFLLTSNAIAADIENLSEKFPVSIDDALPVEKNDLQAQLSIDYEKDDDKEFAITPDFEYGATDNLQLEIGTDIIHGADSRQGSGDIYVGALYKLPVDLTNLAIKGTLMAPTGIDSRGVDHELGLVSTLMLGSGLRTHLDIRWLHNARALPGEEDNGVRTGFGVQHFYNERTSSLISYIRDIELTEDKEFSLLELGCLHSLGEHLSGGAAIGVGIGDDSPDFTARLALQQEL